ncbi:hypothetical protein NEICINOT_04135 [Neisseria cinerea ATCC 14685]|uniref:Uncharacterized protein n=1 Tax=Neisseria cinerea ATCC 14685 TaxID=546262 RepID=D0W398_NEICI|nr:hypothetical protein [Neisseria sp. Marseille-Q6792]EEZ71895.1 hypothetical protein NEICINOT_04135 [Neisseria cinerea ATCC 14685]
MPSETCSDGILFDYLLYCRSSSTDKSITLYKLTDYTISSDTD